MNKDNLLFGIIGLLVGIIGGFVFANTINRTAVVTQPVANTAASASNPMLPPDHPEIGSQTGPQAQIGSPESQTAGGAPLPQVAEAVEKAKQQPNDFEAQMTAGDLYYQVQRYEEAAKFYEQANKIKPGEMEPLVKLGNSYFDAEKFEQAEKWYESALKKDPRNINARTDLGLTFFLRTPRDTDRAIKEYLTALSIDPEHEITLQNLTIAYREKNDTEKLRETVERLKKVNPNNPVVVEKQGP